MRTARKSCARASKTPMSTTFRFRAGQAARRGRACRWAASAAARGVLRGSASGGSHLCAHLRRAAAQLLQRNQPGRKFLLTSHHLPAKWTGRRLIWISYFSSKSKSASLGPRVCARHRHRHSPRAAPQRARAAPHPHRVAHPRLPSPPPPPPAVISFPPSFHHHQPLPCPPP